MAKGKSGGRAVVDIGALVHFVLPHGVARGEHRPAVVVLVLESGAVNLQAFTDGGDQLPCPFFAGGVEQDEKAAPGTWHAPEKG